MSESEGDDNVDIAAIMGFGSFGDQRQPKKRKVDHSMTSSTGANSTSLGIREKPHEQLPVTASRDSPTIARLENVTEAKRSSKPTQGLASYLARGSAIPEGAQQSTTPMEPTQVHSHATSPDLGGGHLEKSSPDLSQQELYRLRKGVRDRNGDEVFFQPSFLEDPWGSKPSHVLG